MKVTISHPMTGGMDQSVAPLRADRSTFYFLKNMRQTFARRGILEQTEYFELTSTFTPGVNTTGTEAATASIYMLNADLSVSTSVCRLSDGTQIQAFYQTVFPAANTIYTGCRLLINDLTNFAITLGQTVDVEMTGTATFRWRKNGGAWTVGLVPSTAGVSIDTGYATLYFLANTGFAGTEAWSWERTDASFCGSAHTLPLQYIYQNLDLYFYNRSDRLMYWPVGKLYVISAGYRPVLGRSLCFFDDHLIVSCFEPDVVGRSSTVPSSTGRTVGWSDRTDYHNFIPTDTNEADSKTLECNTVISQSTSSSGRPLIVGVSVIKQQLFVFLTSSIYVSSALGLPLVFSFLEFGSLQLEITMIAVTPAEQGVYLTGTTQAYFFDGATITPIGFPILHSNSDNTIGSVDGGFGLYDPFMKEFLLFVFKKLYVYQENFKTWYTRAVDFSSSSSPVRCGYVDNYYWVLYLGISSLRKIRPYGGGLTLVYDSSNGTAFALPIVQLQLVGGNLLDMKETDGVYIGMRVPSNTDPTIFTTGSSLKAIVGWYVADSGSMDEITYGYASYTTDANAYVTGTGGFISFPRIPFRALSLQITSAQVTTKPPFQLTLTAIEINARVPAPAIQV